MKDIFSENHGLAADALHVDLGTNITMKRHIPTQPNYYSLIGAYICQLGVHLIE